MKFLAPLLTLCLFQMQLHAAPQNWKLEPVPAGQKLTALSPGRLEPFQSQPIQLRAARGEWENFQFVVTAGDLPLKDLKITGNGLASVGGDFIPASNLSFYRENYVFVKHPSGNRVLTPKWWPDALIPFEIAEKNVEVGKSAVFWASLKIPETTPPGDYYGEIDFLAAGLPRRLAVTLTVEDKALPALRFRGTVAIYYDALRDWYKKDGQVFSDEEWAAQKKRYYDFLLDYRINAYDLPVAWNSPEADKYLLDPRVLSVRTPQLDAPDFPIALEKLTATGTLRKAFYYWIDEPQTPEQFAAVRAATQKLRALGIKHLVTAHPNAVLKNEVDIWCPNIGDFFGTGHLDTKALENERKAGRETWLYTMIVPKYPIPTWLLDDDAASVRAYASIWQSGGFNGFVYSMAHGWGPKPLENLESFEGTNGDGTLLYPAEIVGGAGPMPSIRLMLLRDAIEDFEMKRGAPSPWLRANPSSLTQPAAGRSILDSGREKTPTYPLTAARWMRQNGFLTVNFDAQSPADKEYVAVELAPRDGSEKWRFVLTRKGTQVVERRTREGAFRLPEFAFEAKTRFWQPLPVGPVYQKYFLKIPLRQIPWASRGVRFDLVRSTQMAQSESRFMQRLTPEGEDPYALPLLAVAK